MKQVRKKLAHEEIIKAEREQEKAAPEKNDELNLGSISKKVIIKQERYRLVYLPINVADAKNHIGSTVKVKRKNVPEKEYRLIGSSGKRLEFSQRAGRGSYSFHYEPRDIEKIRVLTKQLY